MTELKPCPLCGNELQPIDFLTENGDYPELVSRYPYKWVIRCEACGMEIEAVTRKSAKLLWNTRPIEDALRARIAELERMQLRLIENANNLIQLANFNNPKAVEYCEQHTQLMREIQPPEICKTCGGSGTVHWKYDDPDYDAEVDASAPCPDCKPEDK